jgi:hypothetical protein
MLISGSHDRGGNAFARTHGRDHIFSPSTTSMASKPIRSSTRAKPPSQSSMPTPATRMTRATSQPPSETTVAKKPVAASTRRVQAGKEKPSDLNKRSGTLSNQTNFSRSNTPTTKATPLDILDEKEPIKVQNLNYHPFSNS